MNTFNVKVVDKPEEAPNYNRDEIDTRALTITDVIVVKDGTVEHRPTVDIVLVAEDGSKFVAMTTGRLIQALATIIQSAQNV